MQSAVRRKGRRIAEGVHFLTMNPVCGFAAALLLTILAGVRESAGGIIFEKERIDASVVACDTLEISGIYYFVNKDSAVRTARIYYPFPVDSFHDYPHSIRIIRLSKKRDTAYDVLPEGIGWTLSIAPGATDSIRVIYRQKIHHGQGRYILTTTELWNRPLDKADFTVTLPPRITLEYWSFQFDSLSENGGSITYFVRRRLFLPAGDMLMKWRCE
jgi:hypothetical protein